MGWNGWSDASKSQFYPDPSPSNVVSSMLVVLGAVYDDGNGATVDFNLWDAAGTGEPTGTPLGTTTVSLAALNAAAPNGGTIQIDFIPNVTVTGDFHAGMSMNGFAGNDTIGIVTNSANDNSPNGSW